MGFEETWAIVDLFGHQRLAGLVSEATIGGGSFIRVDVPGVEGHEPFTRYFGGAAIYSISPCTEAVAKAIVKVTNPRPVTPYDIPQLQQLAAAELSPDEEEDEYDAEEDEYDNDVPF